MTNGPTPDDLIPAPEITLLANALRKCNFALQTPRSGQTVTRRMSS